MMRFIRLYTRVLGLLGPEARLGFVLAIANILLAVAAFAEPILFGRIIDSLISSQSKNELPTLATLGPLLAAWVGFGLFTIGAGVLIALHADGSRTSAGSASSPATSSTCWSCRSPITAARIPAA